LRLNYTTSKSYKQKFFFGQSKRQNFLKNRTGDEPHPVRARSARNTAKTLAIFANRRTKNRKNFGKFENGAVITRSANLF
jgi:hypothetical protein